MGTATEHTEYLGRYNKYRIHIYSSVADLGCLSRIRII